MTDKPILYMATVVSLITYLFWSYLPKGSFYIGNAIFILLLCVYLFLNDRGSVIKFTLISLSINNLLDEMFFDNTKLELNEILTVLTIFIFALIKNKNVRKRPYNT
mgnify:CR=1 FL=1|tara:strand:+ start:916 stop:1233 length:318 start_codon:yes stop_codon:yes gene_type:complete